jgi:hypothetical protein
VALDCAADLDREVWVEAVAGDACVDWRDVEVSSELADRLLRDP